MQLAEVFRARVIDVAPEALIFEITGTRDKIEGLASVLAEYGIVEMVRTGAVAMLRSAPELAAEIQEEPRATSAA